MKTHTLASLPIVFLMACGGAPSQDPSSSAADRSGIVKIAVDAGSPAPTCSGGGFGNANGACSTDESFFNSAVADCKENHQVLAAFKADEHCGAGSSSSATYSCCATAPSGGSSGGFGNANGVCDSDSSMFTTAEESCRSDGFDITAFAPSESCGKGSSSSATYTCSPTGAKPPPPPPPSCSSGGFGNAKGVCSTDLSFFDSAVADCAENKQVLTAFVADEHCAAGSSSSATYSCCTTAPGGSGGGFGNANGLCDSDASMFLSAEQACKSDGQEIVGFVPSESCGKGSSDSATYTCSP